MGNWINSVTLDHDQVVDWTSELVDENEDGESERLGSL
jgi:hypothetical protein